MALSTAGTYLMYKADEVGTYAKLVDIINYPDLGSAPNKIDTTNLSATVMKTFIFGLMEAPDFSFECNYDDTEYNTIANLAGDTLYLQLQFGEGGADGTFSWQGQVQVYVMGGGVDEQRKMTVVCSAETEIVVS